MTATNSSKLLFILACLLFVSASYAENSTQQIERLLSLKQAPDGIVFEIVSASADSLESDLPIIHSYIKKLRTRFPKLEIAIVSHGNEQFALKTSNKNKHKKVHSLTQQLVEKNNVQLHVCGTYATWKGVSEEEFPDYVDVAAEGPATINDYISLGYTLIRI